MMRRSDSTYGGPAVFHECSRKNNQGEGKLKVSMTIWAHNTRFILLATLDLDINDLGLDLGISCHSSGDAFSVYRLGVGACSGAFRYQF